MTEPNAAPVKILIVEDSPTQAVLIERLFRDRGYETRLTTDGRQALEAARRDRPAVIISDVKMPVMDGFELCRAVKQDPALSGVPVILLTSLSEPSDLLLSLEAGADFHIPKPYQADYLAAKMAEVLARHGENGGARPAADDAMVFAGKTYNISAAREHILRLLYATYEVASLQNRQLLEAQDEQRVLNEKLTDSMASLIERTNQLEMANKELESFSYSVSHDLRAPLRAMDGFSQALLEEYAAKLDDQGRDYLGRVRAAANRMAQLIDDLLKLARVSRVSMNRATTDLSALARTAAQRLTDTQPDRRVEFVIQPGLSAEGDPEMLQAAIAALMHNAWKFTSKKTPARIEFGAAEVGGRRAFFVRDDGAGFDMTYVDKLFGPFQRLHGQTEFPGTGIGLAIVRSIVRRHGGKTWAEGAVDKGATVYFILGT